MSGNGISWAICKSAPRSRQITTPAPHHSVFAGRMPFLQPNQQRQSIAWWKEARWVWTVCLRLLPDSIVAVIWTQTLLHLSPAWATFTCLVLASSTELGRLFQVLTIGAEKKCLQADRRRLSSVRRVGTRPRGLFCVPPSADSQAAGTTLGLPTEYLTNHRPMYI